MLRPLVLLAIASVGCGPSEVPTPRLDRGPGPSAESDPLGAALHEDLVAYGGMMEPYETLRRGQLHADGTAEQSVILPAGYCYSVFARVDRAAGTALTLRLVDSNGDPRQLDRREGHGARIGLTEPLCPEPTTEFRVELRASGPGAYVMQVLRASML